MNNININSYISHETHSKLRTLFLWLLTTFFDPTSYKYKSAVEIIPSFSFMKVTRTHLWWCTWKLSKFLIFIFPETFMKVQLKSFQVCHLWKLPGDIHESAPVIFPSFSFSRRHLWKCSWNHSKFLIYKSYPETFMKVHLKVSHLWECTWSNSKFLIFPAQASYSSKSLLLHLLLRNPCFFKSLLLPVAAFRLLQ